MKRQKKSFCAKIRPPFSTTHNAVTSELGLQLANKQKLWSIAHRAAIVCGGLVLFGATALGLNGSCQGQVTHHWTGSVDDLYGNKLNWSTGAIPGSTDMVVFDVGGSVRLENDWEIASIAQEGGNTVLRAGANDATYNVTDGSVVESGILSFDTSGTTFLTVNLGDWLAIKNGSMMVAAGDVNQAGQLLVGTNGTGVLQVENSNSNYSNSFTGTSFIGDGAGGDGTMLVQNDGKADFSSALIVAGNGADKGRLEVGTGGELSAASISVGDGTAAQEALLQVSGTGSKVTTTSDQTFTVGGASGEALVKVLDGGMLYASAGKTRVNASGVVEIGNTSTAGTMVAGQELYLQQGHVAIDHFDSQLAADSMVVDGGVFALKNGTVSVSSDSPNFSGGLIVGQGSGTGSLSITNGGILENTVGTRIGLDEGSSGAVSVAGAGSLWQEAGTTSVGTFGSGEVTISNGGIAALSNLIVGDFPSGIGEITVGGAGSQLTAGTTYLGFDGVGNLTIENGGSGTASSTSFGFSSTGEGSLMVTGTDSSWTSDNVRIGFDGIGNVTIENGGIGTVDATSFGLNSTGVGSLVVTGTDSRWTTSSMNVGSNGTGHVQVLDGGLFENTGNTSVRVGYFNDSMGTILVSGNGSEMNFGASLILGNNGEGQLDVLAGGVVNSNTGRLAFMRDYSIGSANVSGAGSQWNVAGSLEVGTVGTAALNITDAGSVVVTTVSENDRVVLGESASSLGSATIQGAGSVLVSERLIIAEGGTGNLHLFDGGSISASGYSTIGMEAGSVGTALVHGPGTLWDNGGNLNVGEAGSGQLEIQSGGIVRANGAYLGKNLGGNAIVEIDGANSELDIQHTLNVGFQTDASVNVTGGGQLSSNFGVLGSLDTGNGTVQVSGTDSTWDVGNSLTIGDVGTGLLEVASGGQVNVGNSLAIGEMGTVRLLGGTLRLDGTSYENLGSVDYLSGTLSLAGDQTLGGSGIVGDFLGINPVIAIGKHLEVDGTGSLIAATTLDGGTLSLGAITQGELLDFQRGTLNLTASDLAVGTTGAFGETVSLGNQQNLNVTQDVNIASEGLVSVSSGARLSANTLINQGEVILGGGTARIATSSNTFVNQGRLSGGGRIGGAFENASGGIVELQSGQSLTFNSDIQNQVGGRITGRGQLVAPAIRNHGELLFSGGFTDVDALVESFADSKVIVTGGSTTTFFGDIEIEGGAELRVSDLSNAVFFDHVQLRDGALLTGDGNVYFEGSLGIGNSPSRQEFGFDVTLGAASNLLVEIAGVDGTLPEYDQYVFLKDLTLLGGTFSVDLIGLNDGDSPYVPQLGDQFQVIEVSGNWQGEFGNFVLPELDDGLRWDTSGLYSGGMLGISAVPEPSGSLVIFIAAAALATVRRRY